MKFEVSFPIFCYYLFAWANYFVTFTNRPIHTKNRKSMSPKFNVDYKKYIQALKSIPKPKKILYGSIAGVSTMTVIVVPVAVTVSTANHGSAEKHIPSRSTIIKNHKTSQSGPRSLEVTKVIEAIKRQAPHLVIKATSTKSLDSFPTTLKIEDNDIHSLFGISFNLPASVSGVSVQYSLKEGSADDKDGKICLVATVSKGRSSEKLEITVSGLMSYNAIIDRAFISIKRILNGYDSYGMRFLKMDIRSQVGVNSFSGLNVDEILTKLGFDIRYLTKMNPFFRNMLQVGELNFEIKPNYIDEKSNQLTLFTTVSYGGVSKSIDLAIGGFAKN